MSIIISWLIIAIAPLFLEFIVKNQERSLSHNGSILNRHVDHFDTASDIITDAKKDLIFIVEGLFDGLTIAEKMKDKDYNLIILNSTENLNNKAIEVLKGYKNIIIGFDNDHAGINAENKIIERINNSEIYQLKFRANDLNEAWVLKEKIEVVRLNLFSRLGLAHSLHKSFTWYLKAAKDGSQNAEEMVGGMYLKGIGVKKNKKIACYWFAKSGNSCKNIKSGNSSSFGINNILNGIGGAGKVLLNM